MNHIKIKLPDCDDDVKLPRVVWCIVLSSVWILWIIHRANVAYERAAVQLAAQSGLNHWWNRNAPDAARGWAIVWGALALYGIFLIAHFAAIIQVAIQKGIAQKNRRLQTSREQLAFENKMQVMDQENDQQDKLSKLAQSKQELIMRLGTIDQFIRVLAVETDVSQRTVALQAAHSEITTLAAKLASGQISRDVVEAPEVREQASETSNDLTRLGLSEDRLNRDLLRMFKLSSK